MWAIEPHQPSTAEGSIKKNQNQKKNVYLVDHFISVLLPQGAIKNVHQEKKNEPVA